MSDETFVDDEEIKEFVRQRDDYRCQDCGITQDEYRRKAKKRLDVHRLLPGSGYHPECCVTLCKECHGRKPKTLWQALQWDYQRSGVCMFYLNLYKEQDRIVFNTLRQAAERSGIEFSDMLDRVLRDYCSSFPQDYCI